MDNISRRGQKTVPAARLYKANSQGKTSASLHFDIAGSLAANDGNLSDLIMSEPVWHMFDANSLSLAISASDSAYPLRAADTVLFSDAGWGTAKPYVMQESGFNPNRFFFEIDGNILNISAIKKYSSPISGGGFGGTGHGPFTIASSTLGDGGIAGTGNTGGSGDGGIAGTGNTGGSGDGAIAGPGNAPASSDPGDLDGVGSESLPDAGSGNSSPNDAETKAVTSSSTESHCDKGGDGSRAPQLVTANVGGKPKISYVEDIFHDTAGPAPQMTGDHLIAHINYTPVDYSVPASEVFPV